MKKILKKSFWFTAITILCFIVVTSFLATGCDKPENPNDTLEKTNNKPENPDEVETNSENPDEAETNSENPDEVETNSENPDEVETNIVTKIEAKVENASKYSNVVAVVLKGYDRSTDKNIELARGDWKDGGFIIVLPKTVYPNYYHALINNDREYMTIIDPPSTVSISNKNVKVFHARFFGVDKDDNMVTRFYPLKIDKNGYAQDAFLTYVDSDVTISGYTEREGTFTYTEYDNARFEMLHIQHIWWKKITTTYSIKWKKGWNVWFFSRSGNTQTPSTATEKWASTPVSKLKWYSTEDLWIGNRE